MTTHLEGVATPRSPTVLGGRQRPPASASVVQLQIAVLETHIAALEQQLVAERQRRQAVVDRYERLLAEQ